MSSGKTKKGKTGKTSVWKGVPKDGNKFEALSSTRASQHGGTTKRQRRSTGGASNTLAIHDTGVTKLSIETFKTMNVDDKLESIFVCLKNIQINNDSRMSNVEQKVHDLHELAASTNTHIKTLQYKSIDIEARSRRNNLLFQGIPEVADEDCLGTIKSFLTNHLELDPDNMYMHRAHRLGKPRKTNPNNPPDASKKQTRHRPIIVAYRDYQDVQIILDSARKLKGTGYGINKDLPPEIVEARKPLYKKLRDTKSRNPHAKAFIAFPAKLVVNGKTLMDGFPDWRDIMRRSRIDPARMELVTDDALDENDDQELSDSDTDNKTSGTPSDHAQGMHTPQASEYENDDSN